MLPRERPLVPARALMLPPRRAEAADRSLSALAFALMLASWSAVYVAVLPPDRAMAHRVHAVELRGPGRL